jgi:hypothetical protein
MALLASSVSLVVVSQAALLVAALLAVMWAAPRAAVSLVESPAAPTELAAQRAWLGLPTNR